MDGVWRVSGGFLDGVRLVLDIVKTGGEGGSANVKLFDKVI